MKLGLCLNLSLSLYMVFVVLFLRVLTWLFYYRAIPVVVVLVVFK